MYHRHHPYPPDPIENQGRWIGFTPARLPDISAGNVYMGELTSGRVIAIIDDNEDNRFVFRTYFEDRHRVMEFAEGREAIVSMKTDVPDIIFLDISLPGIDGLEVLRQIRQDHQLRHLPVIAVTAHAMIGDRERFLNAGFDGYVSKPIDFTQVTQIIERPFQMSAKSAH
jgi:two-component system, cell cycle response regulator DivK